jgi:hypothetical protein
MAGLKVSHVGAFMFHAMKVSVLLRRGAISRGKPLRYVIIHQFCFVLKIAFVFAARTGTRTTRTSRYSTTTLMATERKTLGIAGYSIKLMSTRRSDVERREGSDAQRESKLLSQKQSYSCDSYSV